MTFDISSLRKARSSSTDIAKITAEFEKQSKGGGGYTKDTRFWSCEQDKAGNGSAVIRFLPNLPGQEFPWVRTFSHSFQGPSGKWYIEDSLTTIGEADPVQELNNKLWASGSKADEEIARKQKRKTSYIMNILVVSDPKHPENEGKVFLFKFGKKIFDKIMDKAKPEFEDEKPLFAYDFWEGANFRLRIRKVDGFANYDKSEFDSVSAIGTDEEIVEIAKQMHNLGDFTDKTKFKSYEELSKKLQTVLADGFSMPSAESDAAADAKPAAQAKAAPKATPKAEETPAAGDEVDDALAMFRSMAEDD